MAEYFILLSQLLQFGLVVNVHLHEVDKVFLELIDQMAVHLFEMDHLRFILLYQANVLLLEK